MTSLKSRGFYFKVYSLLPIIILFISVLNEFDFNYLNLEYFSFNFPFILIFFFTIKEFKNFDYLLVFLAGLINDTVVGLPLGISSLSYIRPVLKHGPRSLARLRVEGWRNLEAQ